MSIIMDEICGSSTKTRKPHAGGVNLTREVGPIAGKPRISQRLTNK